MWAVKLVVLALGALSVSAMEDFDDQFYNEQLTDLMADFEASSNHVEISRIKRNIPAALTFREKREALAFELNNEPSFARHSGGNSGGGIRNFTLYYANGTVYNRTRKRNKRESEVQALATNLTETKERRGPKGHGHGPGPDNSNPFGGAFSRKRLMRTKCCGEEVPQEPAGLNQKLAEAKMQCFKENREKIKNLVKNETEEDTDDGFNMFSCARINKTKAELVCMMECVGQKYNIIQPDGSFDNDVTKAFMKENYAVNEWEKVVSDELVEKCIQTVTSNSGDQMVDANGMQCSKHVSKFVYCMWQEYFMSCPTEKQNTDNKRCKKLREKMAKKSSPF